MGGVYHGRHGWCGDIDDVREAAGVVAPQHGMSEMYVYGSVARRGNHIDSDVDLIYSMGPGHKATAGTIMGLKDDLERHLGKDVSLMSKRALLFNAEHTPSGRLFYNAIRADLKQVL
mgnify:CR=1 FL=1